MPPKVKITKEDIINAAVDIVRESGAETLNARIIASVLDCSTQPVFSNFATMEELHKSVVSSVYEIYLNFLRSELERGEYPPYKSFGMAYIRFAKEEKELFKLLFMCDQSQKSWTPTLDFEESVKMIMNANGVTKEKAELIHLEMWTCVHGIAVMTATSFLSFEWDVISGMVTDIYQGLRLRHLSEVK